MRTRHISSSDPVLPPLDPSTSSGQANRGRQQHQPVLLHEVIRALDVQPDDTIVDATLGGAGHAEELVKGLGGNGLFVGFDADPAAIERARECLKGAEVPVRLIHANFRHLANELGKLDVSEVTKVLFDLGLSSYQLGYGRDSDLPAKAQASAGRGFSFLADEPLRMTYGEAEDAVVTAATVVNTWSEKTLADIIYAFGDERYARRIAKAIVERRKKRAFETSRDLATTILEATPQGYRRGRIHPATRTFQAIRIAVNDELGALTDGLRAAWQLLSVGGRIAVISFHSLEDRIVKREFASRVRGGEGRLLFKKPVVPSLEETQSNPRARSAKLRVISKL